MKIICKECGGTEVLPLGGERKRKNKPNEYCIHCYNCGKIGWFGIDLDEQNLGGDKNDIQDRRTHKGA